MTWRDIAAALGFLLFWFLMLTMQIQPRVIGYGCNGGTLPQLAHEEDQLPAPCDSVESIWN